MGVEIRESVVSDEEFTLMKEFVREYLAASVAKENDGGRMRWYPWHSVEYRFNHILNVVELASAIAEQEGADTEVVRIAALFHDIAKLEVDQEIHAEEGARIARQYLETRGDFPESFIQRVCRVIEDHSYQEDLNLLSAETQSLIEADMLDKVGANGMVLMLLRMGYESRTHMDSAQMVQRVFERGKDAASRVQSPTAESIAHRRLKRVKWFREWLEEEVVRMESESDAE